MSKTKNQNKNIILKIQMEIQLNGKNLKNKKEILMDIIYALQDSGLDAGNVIILEREEIEQRE